MRDFKGRSRMKKAQIQSQVLVYVLALLIVGLVLIYGYQSIQKMKANAQIAEFIKFQDTVKKSVNSLKYDYGSVKKRTFYVPGDYREVCFGVPGQTYPSTVNKYPIIKDSLVSEAGRNVFLYPDGIESFNVTDIVVQDNFKCYNVVGGKITVTLEGMGSRVKVS